MSESEYSRFFVTTKTDGAHAGPPHPVTDYATNGRDFAPDVLRVTLCEVGHDDRHFRTAAQLNGYLSHSG